MTSAIEAKSLRGTARLAMLAMIAWCVAAFSAAPVRADPIAVGKGQLTVDVDGTADVKQDPDLTLREGAAAQGAHRYGRGHNAYRAAQSLAQPRGWAFTGKLIDVSGVGHSARRMFGSDAAASAFE